MTSDLKVVSVNVRGLHNSNKRNTIFHWLLDKSIDIICLQETFCTEKDTRLYNLDWKGDVYHCVSDSVHSRGVCIMFKNNFDYKLINMYYSNDGRKILINFECNDKKFTVVNLYAPNDSKSRCDFLKKSERWIKQHNDCGSSLIICGDFNTGLDAIDRNNSKIDESSKQLNKFLKHLDLVDTFRHLYKDKQVYTYFSKNNPLSDSRIDHIFISKLYTYNLDNISIKKVPKVPDHKAVIMGISCNEAKGKGYWKLNTSVLPDITYKNGIQRVVETTLHEYSKHLNARDLWDFVKIRIKEFSISYCIQKCSGEKLKMSNIEKSIKLYESKISISNNKQDILNLTDKKSELENEYENLYTEKAKGAQIRSRCKYIEEGERSTNYFLNLEKRHCNFNRINSLKSANGTRVKNTDEIINTATNFYKELYSTASIPNANVDEYINRIENLNTLTENDALMCEGEITDIECNIAIKNMRSNSSPGLDGIPADFYKKMWDIVGPLVLNSYREAFQEGKLAESHKISVLTLIFKKGDREEIRNYRPISLSNADYKILAFVLSARLQKVIDKLVSESQTAYIKKRFIGENIRLLLDLMDYTKIKNIPGIAIFLDFMKAYDSLEWNFMFKTLDAYGFGPNFKKWVKLLYTEPGCRVKVNGFISEGFNMQRGIRQGCPISALLFILCTELLAVNVSQSNLFEGIEVKDKDKSEKIKISQYADDSTLYLSKIENLVGALSIVESFSNVSGLKLNLKKTEGLCMGSLIGQNIIFPEITWSTTPLRYLGIYIGHNKIENDVRNWEDKLEKMQKLLDVWRLRNLTLFGKITIVKTLAIPSLIFTATFLIPPDGFIEKINKAVFNFIWNKKDRIKRNCIINDYTSGGLKMVDIVSQFNAIKAAWVPRILNEKNKKWTFLPFYYFNKFGSSNEILDMSFESIVSFPAIKQIPDFYQNMIVAFNGSKIPHFPHTVSHVLNMQIWGNRYLKFKNKTLFSINWMHDGINFIKDIFNPNGKLNYNILFEKIKDKSDYFKVASMICKALSNFKCIFVEDNIINQVVEEYADLTAKPIYMIKDTKVNIEGKRSSFFYLNIIKQKAEKPYQQGMWERKFENRQINWYRVFMSKIIKMQDKKIAEYNYKLIMNILVSEDKLYKWKKSEDPNCIYCKHVHSVEHMLFNCIDAKNLWSIVSSLLNKDITYEDIVLGFVEESNNVIDIIGFLIYKKWLIDRENKSNYSLITFITKQLKQRYSMYQLTKYKSSFVNVSEFIIMLDNINELL